jgi:hypothetical protein
MFGLDAIYWIVLVGSPLTLAIAWWGWFRTPGATIPKSRVYALFAGLLAATCNLVFFWSWVAWLQHHRASEVWRIQDRVSDIGIGLLVFSLLATIGGQGRYRAVLAVSIILAFVPWIPIGVL